MAFLSSFESCGPQFLCFFFFLSLPFFLRFFPLQWLSLSLDDEELLSLSLEEAKEEANKLPGSSSSRGACKLIWGVIAAVPPQNCPLGHNEEVWHDYSCELGSWRGNWGHRQFIHTCFIMTSTKIYSEILCIYI